MSLEEHLKKLITNNGPITIAQFMADSLTHPEHGYYQKQKPFGKEGDFTTSPEISQIFGELVGIWCASVWQQMGSPANISIVELGPGRGTLMKDFIRGTKHVNGFHKAMEIHMVEVSRQLQQVQQKNLKESHGNIHWHSDMTSLPAKTSIFIANEFFDALPIHQYEKTTKGWCEKLMDIADGKLAFTLASPISLPGEHKNAANGNTLEACPTAITIMQDISARIEMENGAALIIDYGYIGKVYKDTLQAVKNHKYHPILEDIGSADITAHVNFSELSKAATEYDVNICNTITQRDFLLALGIELRTQSLIKNANDKQKQQITSATERLINADEMGNLFKVLAITGKNLTTPAGF